jgi:hypothetical protein
LRDGRCGGMIRGNDRQPSLAPATGRAMPQPLKLRILEGDRPAFEISLVFPLLLGRQRKGDPGPYALLPPTARPGW